MSIGPPIPDIQYFQNFTMKIQGHGHSSRSESRYNTLSTHVPFVPCWSALLFLGYSYFKIWRWKFKVKVMGEWGQSWKSQHGSNIQATHIHFVPCQSGIPFLSYDFFNIWPWKSRVNVIGEVTVQVTMGGSNILSTHIPFVPCQSALPFLRYSIFKIWPWKSRVNVKWPWFCTTTGPAIP